MPWALLETDAVDAFDGRWVELTGWVLTLDAMPRADYGLLVAEPACCAPRDPRAAVEVYFAAPVTAGAGVVTLSGRWCRLVDDPAGWRYQLRDAQVIDTVPETMTAPVPRRRLFLAAGAALGLVACSAGRFAPYTEPAAGQTGASNGTATNDPNAATSEAAIKAWLAPLLTIDMHSHAGRVIISRDPAIGAERPFLPVAAPMREGGMKVICLTIVTDTVVTRVTADRLRFEAYRQPNPGELYALSQTAFARANTLIEREGLSVITDAAGLRAAAQHGPSVIIASEGADFLEGDLTRVDEAYHQHRLRHLQLTHYRVNKLGDIQTEPPVHGGLSDFGADVVRRCNALGIVVDVAHGTYDLVKRAAAVTIRPLVLSHTSLSEHPSRRSRQITPDHARVIAGTGGVIGVWPSGGIFTDLAAMSTGVRRMVDVVGIDHVGLGSDMLGFISPPVFSSYRQLPAYAAALLTAGFSHVEVGQMLGGNYLRVFEAVLSG